MGLFVFIMALVLVIAMWAVGEQEFRTKLILTIVYLATWGLFFVDGWAVLAAQAIFCIVVGFWTFGKHFRR
jgi:hypothetical protein